jgi:hypothetical protein
MPSPKTNSSIAAEAVNPPNAVIQPMSAYDPIKKIRVALIKISVNLPFVSTILLLTQSESGPFDSDSALIWFRFCRHLVVAERGP